MKGFTFIAVLVVLGCWMPAGLRAQTETKLTAGDGAGGDRFGETVSISGDYAMVGALPGAYIYRRNGTSWVEVDKLTAGVANSFGASVAIDGAYAVVGADGDDDNGLNSGSAYIYGREGTQWVQKSKMTAGDAAEWDELGASVSISGDYAIVGAAGDDDQGDESGAAYVFRREGSTWVEMSKLTAGDGAAYQAYGVSVSISGDYAMVGASGDNDQGTGSGAVYVLHRQGADWEEVGKLTAGDGAEGDRFGTSVSLSGDYAIVGAQYDGDNGIDSGSAYVFHRQGADWEEVGKLIAGDGAEGDRFGWSVSIDGDLAIVGAPNDNARGAFSGSAYVFRQEGTAWKQVRKLTASDGAQEDAFGYSVSVAGRYAVVGALGDDEAGNDAGSAYVYDLFSAPDITSTADTDAVAGQPYSYQVVASGIPLPTFSLVAAPSQMTIDAATGLIVWTPSQTGSFNATVRASNAVGADEQSFTITVNQPLVAPRITSPAPTTATVGQVYAYDVEASGHPVPTFSLSTAPGGMSIDAVSGIITWTPVSEGEAEVVIVASNGVSPAATQRFTISVITATSTEEAPNGHHRVELAQNYPNPVRGMTAIRYGLPEGGRVRLVVYNVLGQEVAVLAEGAWRGAGYHEVVWDGRDREGREVAGGLYVYRIEVETVGTPAGRGVRMTRRLVVVR